jgi:hypothetical protein
VHNSRVIQQHLRIISDCIVKRLISITFSIVELLVIAADLPDLVEFQYSGTFDEEPLYV